MFNQVCGEEITLSLNAEMLALIISAFFFSIIESAIVIHALRKNESTELNHFSILLTDRTTFILKNVI